VEDDPSQRELLGSALAEAGYAVRMASSGQQALDYLVSGAEEPSLILLDLSMPVMSGWEFLAIAKSYARLAQIPVVLVSGESPRHLPLLHGAVAAHLSKPIDLMTVFDAVSRFARRPSASAAIMGAQ
jgi:CheY-like chemotaxis protein